MRAVVMVSLALGILMALADWSTAEEFPYVGYVKADDVYVRSGPGRNYYPTDKLAKDAEVEVYRRDPGGWLAIRPPQGSYSWVSARYVRPQRDGVAEVTDQSVVARVGSKFSSVRDVIQVRLEKGELVEILGEHNAGGQTWYKIAAPAGEFRWIAGQFVHGEPPHQGVSKPRALADRGPMREEVRRSQTEGSWNETVAYETGERETDGVRSRQAAERSHEPLPGPPDPRGWSGQRTRVANDPPPADFFDAEIAAIEREISIMAAEEPSVWSLNELHDRVNQLSSESSTAVERGRVRHLERKIARMDDIHHRYRTANNALAESERFDRTRRAGHNSDSGFNPSPPAGVEPGEFDGEGILRPVVSRRPDAPRYALIDDAGRVRSFLTATPGLNLQPYIGEPVGVTGSRGYLPDLRKPHVMVQRLTPLRR